MYEEALLRTSIFKLLSVALTFDLELMRMTQSHIVVNISSFISILPYV
jgi:hypothetical protein